MAVEADIPVVVVKEMALLLGLQQKSRDRKTLFHLVLSGGFICDCSIAAGILSPLLT
jgi:hypothetical protein